jgi:hypothetical protein
MNELAGWQSEWRIACLASSISCLVSIRSPARHINPGILTRNSGGRTSLVEQ